MQVLRNKWEGLKLDPRNPFRKCDTGEPWQSTQKPGRPVAKGDAAQAALQTLLRLCSEDPDPGTAGTEALQARHL